ncbi:MAG: hypothetical protein Q7S92_04735 [Candidatus Diapherotrites archaeon]|nr:hypothetical protein [Candidatus Diapherotrites archaeon]
MQPKLSRANLVKPPVTRKSQNRRPKLMERLKALHGKIPLNPTAIMKSHPGLYRLLCAEFGTYGNAVESALGIPYEKVRLNKQEIERRQKDAGNRKRARMSDKEKSVQIYDLIRNRRLAMRRHVIGQQAKVLSLRLQGYPVRVIQEFLGVQKLAVTKRGGELRKILPQALVERLKQIELARRSVEEKDKLEGSLVFSKPDAEKIAGNFQKTEWKKFNSVLKQIYEKRLTGKTNSEIAVELNIPEKNIVSFTRLLSVTQFREIRILELKQVKERVWRKGK